ncbi:PucR family transcriptional regulator [Arthrobacter echini]|uniref:PucR family transcriptional regulator n=1 Tax=Arthrobacter echini TaxID=1529066 RepID=A0A4V3Z5Z7_9MICC|nr:helix-turn-helix domain-containing protein [Arthrobacter echini]THJ68619.1 PucR family transcriptional regulator [Arthrobacter echini]
MQNQAIEDLVESLAQRLGRGLSLEDPDGVLLAYSSHQSSADRVRVNFLLSKKVPADVADWQLRHGIAEAVRPVVVPSNEALGMRERVCVPLLVRGFRVGYLWVQQQSDDDPASGILEALPTVRRMTDRLAELLLETDAASSERRARREEAFLGACDGVLTAVEELRGWREFDGDTSRRIAVVHELSAATMTGPEDAHEAILLQRTLALHSTVGVPSVLFSAGASTHSVLLCVRDIARGVLPQVLDRYRAEVPKRAGRPPGRLVLGMSEPVTDPRELAGAFDQAVHAVRAAAVDPGLGNVVSYAGIGIYQFLSALTGPIPAHPSVRFTELSRADRLEELVPVLELLYDKNGSVQDIAEQLHLHRSTVYNRLARIRAIIGVDPLVGPARLELHLALKARRWRSRPRLDHPG